MLEVRRRRHRPGLGTLKVPSKCIPTGQRKLELPLNENRERGQGHSFTRSPQCRVCFPFYTWAENGAWLGAGKGREKGRGRAEGAGTEQGEERRGGVSSRSGTARPQVFPRVTPTTVPTMLRGRAPRLCRREKESLGASARTNGSVGDGLRLHRQAGNRGDGRD